MWNDVKWCGGKKEEKTVKKRMEKGGEKRKVDDEGDFISESREREKLFLPVAVLRRSLSNLILSFFHSFMIKPFVRVDKEINERERKGGEIIGREGDDGKKTFKHRQGHRMFSSLFVFSFAHNRRRRGRRGGRRRGRRRREAEMKSAFEVEKSRGGRNGR